jgi:hypothetical protein
MTIIICPGIHSQQLTANFIQSTKTNWQPRDYLVLPTTQFSPYSAIAIEQWLKQNYGSPSVTQPLSFIAFSAGVVGAIGAALAWQLQGGKIQHFIAVDGWGMPLIGNFPYYRISHDYFTHWSSSILGTGKVNFYADPEVEHLDLWRSPEQVSGWRVLSSGLKTRDSLTNFYETILNS